MTTKVTPLSNQIGQTAGVVWQYLSKNKEATAVKIRKETKLTDELLHQAIGWLAREDKIQFNPAGKFVKISLKHGV